MPGAEHADPHNLLVEDIIHRTKAKEAAETKRKLAMHQTQYHEELEKELEGTQYTPVATESQKNADEEDATEDNSLQQVAMDDDSLSTITMSRKKWRLYKAMKAL